MVKESVSNKVNRKIFFNSKKKLHTNQHGRVVDLRVFNKTMILLKLAGYKMIMTNITSLHIQGPVSQKSRNFPVLSDSGATISFISSQRRGSKPPNFAILLVFLTLK